jgi:hypothetical protein
VDDVGHQAGRGLLAVGYRSIRILDGAALQRLAGGRP